LAASQLRAAASEGQHNLALLQKLLQPAELDLYDPSHLALLQAMEHNDLVDPVEEFGTEMCAPSSRTAEVSSPSGWLTRNSACHFCSRQSRPLRQVLFAKPPERTNTHAI
jgi:hypothetical protein